MTEEEVRTKMKEGFAKIQPKIAERHTSSWMRMKQVSIIAGSY